MVSHIKQYKCCEKRIRVDELSAAAEMGVTAGSIPYSITKSITQSKTQSKIPNGM